MRRCRAGNLFVSAVTLLVGVFSPGCSRSSSKSTSPSLSESAQWTLLPPPPLSPRLTEVHDRAWGVARTKLAMEEPPIRRRLPGLEIVSATSATSRTYGPRSSAGPPIEVKGESISIGLNQAQKTLVEASWSSRFPDVLPPGSGPDPPNVSVEDLLDQLFRFQFFTQKDLGELVHSNVPEVRIAVVASLKNQSLLSEAVSDSDPRVRATAVTQLIDQAIHASTGLSQTRNLPLSRRGYRTPRGPEDCGTCGWLTGDDPLHYQHPSVLLNLVLETRNSSVAIAVAERLNDQSALTRVAVEHKDSMVRLTAVKKITDQSLLARIAKDEHDPLLRSAALINLNDESLLARMATQDIEPRVRSEAVKRIFDQSLLAMIAIQDHDPQVRSAAVGNSNLTDQSLLVKIGYQDSDAQVRSAAVEKVTDQPALARSAARDVDQKVRERARLRLELLRKMQAAARGR